MNREEFKEKITKVGKILDYEVEFKDEFLWCFMSVLKKENGKILVYYIEAKDRIFIESSYPRANTGEYFATSRDKVKITVSGNQPAEKIAREIQKRFLPEYLPRLERIIKSIREIEERHRQHAESLELIANRFGWKVESNQKIYPRTERVYCIEPYYFKNEVKFEVKATPEQAIKILEILLNEEGQK